MLLGSAARQLAADGGRLVTSDVLALIIEAYRRVTGQVLAIGEQLERAGLIPKPPSSDPRQRALDARRNRNTGPALPPLGRGR